MSSSLAAFQRQLLQICYEAKNASEARAQLLERAGEFGPYADYIEKMDQRMLDVACELARKWCVPTREP